MACSTRGFGAPVTDAGGSVAAQERAEPDLGAQRAAHGAHEVVQAGVRLERAERRHLHRSRLAHAPEVVAREVDDHHVLGVVLGARAAGGRRRRRCP